jgi:hypothetical protein
MQQNHFNKFILNLEHFNTFETFSESCAFENIGRGRSGANLIRVENGTIPIVRTTTSYHSSSQRMSPLHLDLMEKIKNTLDNNVDFNNALIEIYDSRYCSMKFHSDQTLDLDPNSYICLFSCYENTKNLRTLQIKNKNTEEMESISLEHNSIILFSVEDNRKYLHKIMLENNRVKNRYLGITFRLSKTYIKFVDERPYFVSNNLELTLADENERHEFYKNKSEENNQIDYVYSEINCTISISDMLPV